MLSVTLHLVFSFILQIDIRGMPHKNFRPARAHLPEVDTKQHWGPLLSKNGSMNHIAKNATNVCILCSCALFCVIWYTLALLKGHWESYKCVKVVLNPEMEKFCQWTLYVQIWLGQERCRTKKCLLHRVSSEKKLKINSRKFLKGHDIVVIWYLNKTLLIEVVRWAVNLINQFSSRNLPIDLNCCLVRWPCLTIYGLRFVK